jgi:hypothetical protein
MLKENITGVIFIPGDKTAIERKRLASSLVILSSFDFFINL